MKICVVGQSRDFAGSAGWRIRYGRLTDIASETGVEISHALLGQLSKLTAFDHDLYIFVKTVSPQSYVIGRRIRDAGKLLAIDIFDDYFSQTENSRLGFQRLWLSTIAGIASFFLCSTPTLAGIIRDRLKVDNVYVMRDSAPPVDTFQLAHTLQRKLAVALNTRRLDLLWFGMGDNPHFPLGLTDLAGYGADLQIFHVMGWDVRLKILTNRRALTLESLALLRPLPVKAIIEEWSEAAEVAEIDAAIACFLPVNHQHFSQAKSLNRATTALAGGSQVISPGHPLYSDFDPFILRKALSLARCLEKECLPLRRSTVPMLTAKLLGLADPFKSMKVILQAAEAAHSLESKIVTSRRSSNFSLVNMRNVLRTGFKYDLGLIHGKSVSSDAHKTITGLGGLSVKSPITAGAVNFHVRVNFHAGQHRVLIDENIADLIPKIFQDQVRLSERLLETNYLEVPIDHFASSIQVTGARYWQLSSRAAELAAAHSQMLLTKLICRQLFPHTTFYTSENDNIFAESG